MISICLYFEVHQPYRLKPYSFFDIGSGTDYFDQELNRTIARKVSEKCYLPATQTLLDLIKKHGEDFQCTFAISGTALEQFRDFCPDVLDNFKRLAATGQVEFLAETYYHSLSALMSEKEFRKQVRMHMDLMRQELGVNPINFRNTELIYSNHVAYLASRMGFRSILLEGTEKILGWRSPNFVYRPLYSPEIKCFLKNYRLSDDIAFRFSNKGWAEFPLNADKFSKWVHQVAGNGTVINLFMDFETFGEHQWEDTGIFAFLHDLPGKVLQHADFHFDTIGTAARKNFPVGDIDTDSPISWADSERDISAWMGNSMQREAIHALYDLEEEILAADNERLLEIWRKLQTSDHFYYMSTKYWSDGDVHKYFSPYNTPHDAYIYFMNALQDLRQCIHLNTVLS